VLALRPEPEDLHVVPEAERERVRRLAPRTISLLDAVPAIRAYAFSVVAPGGVILAHRHHNRYVTALLTLQSDDAVIAVAGERAPLCAGELLIFDYTLVHETVNRGAIPRIALLMLLDNRA
jgi:aspartyl/asparaginyl beta-hydroxylase (cupin superfamily)